MPRAREVRRPEPSSNNERERPPRKVGGGVRVCVQMAVRGKERGCLLHSGLVGHAWTVGAHRTISLVSHPSAPSKSGTQSLGSSYVHIHTRISCYSQREANNPQKPRNEAPLRCVHLPPKCIHSSPLLPAPAVSMSALARLRYSISNTLQVTPGALPTPLFS